MQLEIRNDTIFNFEGDAIILPTAITGEMSGGDCGFGTRANRTRH